MSEKLRQEIRKANTNNMRRHQLTVMPTAVERTNKAPRNRRLANQCSFLVDLGVIDQSEVNKVITDPDAPLPELIEQGKEKALQNRKNQRKSLQRRQLEDKIKRAFENPWLVELEKEMAEHSRRAEHIMGNEERAVLSLLEINSNKL